MGRLSSPTIHLCVDAVLAGPSRDSVDVARHARMVSLVERMLDLHKRVAAEQTPHVKTVLQRHIEATDREIDRLVYELRPEEGVDGGGNGCGGGR